jgi:glycosyltransferase involved in cell wall biosynthesis
MSQHQLPKISIVVPSYNQGRFLRDTLESIFSQEYPSLEVIVIDGGSTDESVDIIREYESHLKFWRSHRDEGQTAAINEGMTHCTGEIVAWLNSDDFYWQDALWTVGRAYLDHPHYGLYIGNGLRFNHHEKTYTPFAPLHVTLNRAALTQGLDYILQPSTFFLRHAWQAVGGLQKHLNYTMDWDVIIRISNRFPAVTINEFLGVSREYEETKTSTGMFKRAFEIIQLTQKHGNTEITAGAEFYLFETLLNAQTGDLEMPDVKSAAWDGMLRIFGHFKKHYGGLNGFPEVGDPQDVSYIPRARCDLPTRARNFKYTELPSISIVIPSFNQAAFIGRTLESIVSQNYPRVEVWVMDGGSTDNTMEVVQQYAASNIRWISERDRGPAHAINKGFRRANGELLMWLASDDMLAVDALWEVARIFMETPETELVYANALYVDEQDKLFLADHGTHKTGLYYGKMQPRDQIPAYWQYVHSVPQPTVFFRRHLYFNYGGIDENYKFIFDFELFFRLSQTKIKKLERTTALYRIHTQSKTGGDWSNFLIELYRFSRPKWSARGTPGFKSTFKSYVDSYVKQRIPNPSRTLRTRLWYNLLRASVYTGIGNPESWGVKRRQKAAKQVLPVQTVPSTVVETPVPKPMLALDRKFTSHFCSLTYPRTPGYSGGEIRDFHILRHLLTISSADFWMLYDFDLEERRPDVLRPYINANHQPEPQSIAQEIAQPTLEASLSVLHKDVHYHYVRAQLLSERIQRSLENDKPDFFFISPQTNPVALLLNKKDLQTRFIMASYDVEAVRVERLLKSRIEQGEQVDQTEIERSEQFERQNLEQCDGIIAVSDLDKQVFIERYGYPQERILVLENSVDTEYFAFTPRRAGEENIVFTGSMSYLPNHQAAHRLIHQIMPLVWEERPEAKLWLVGQHPPEDLKASHDGERIFVTGRVDDIRPYLTQAAVSCVPLIAGSGTKYKLLESMSAGLPVVCTPLAAEGLNLIDGRHAFIRDSNAQIAEAVLFLLTQPEAGAWLAEHGRELVQKAYSWEANLCKMDDWLEIVRELPIRKGIPVNE